MTWKNSRVNIPLQNLSLRTGNEGYVAHEALTPIVARDWTGIIASYGDDHLELVTSRVLDRGGYRIVPTVTRSLSKTYAIGNHGLMDIVSERDYEEVKDPFQAEVDVSMGLSDLLKLEREWSLRTLLVTASNYATNHSQTLSGTSQWSDYTNSDPLKNISDAQEKIWTNGRVEAEDAIIGKAVMYKLRLHPKITVPSTVTGKVTPASTEQVAAALGLRKIYVPMATYNNSGTLSDVWGKICIIYNRAQGPKKRQRTFGYKITKAGHDFRTFLKENPNMPNSKNVIMDLSYHFRIEHNNAAFLYLNAVA